jgi:hypothetical protein
VFTGEPKETFSVFFNVTGVQQSITLFRDYRPQALFAFDQRQLTQISTFTPQ